jgi:hypothetical protein
MCAPRLGQFSLNLISPEKRRFRRSTTRINRLKAAIQGEERNTSEKSA